MFEYLDDRYCGSRDEIEEAKFALQYYGINVTLSDREVDSAVKESMKCFKKDDINFYTITTALRTLGCKPTENIGYIEWSTQRPKLSGEFLVIYKESGLQRDCYETDSGSFHREYCYDETPIKWVAIQ